MPEEDRGYPMYLYVYNENGRYGPPTLIKDAPELVEQFETVVIPMTRDKREVVIADCWDSCVYHAKDGKVIWPPKEAVDAAREKP